MARKKIEVTMTVITVGGMVIDRKVNVREVADVARVMLDDYLEMVPYFSQYKGKRCVAFCGENGKRKGLAPNLLATTMWRLELPDHPDYIAGPMVIVQGDEAFMRAL